MAKLVELVMLAALVIVDSRLNEASPHVHLKVLHKGDGETFPATGDRLTVHYVGTLEDGTQFDSSRDRDEPFQFTVGVGEVIKGWDVGMKKMSVGERAVLHVPSDMAYGEDGAGGVIPPDADLDFDVELIKVDAAEE